MRGLLRRLMCRRDSRWPSQAGLSVGELAIVLVFLGSIIYFAIKPLYTNEEGEHHLKMILYFKGVIFEREVAGLSSQVSLFRELHGFLPGDYPRKDLGRPGNGNGRVEWQNGESAEAMRHLKAGRVRVKLGGDNRTEEGRALSTLSQVKGQPDPDESLIGSRVRLQWIPNSPDKPLVGAHYFVLEKMNRGLAHYLDGKYDDGDPDTGDIRIRPASEGDVDLLVLFKGW